MDDFDRFVDSRGRVDKKMLHLHGLISDINLFDEDIRAEGLGGTPLREARGFRADSALAGTSYKVGCSGVVSSASRSPSAAGRTTGTTFWAR